MRKEESDQDRSDSMSEQTNKRVCEHPTETVTEMEQEGFVAQKRRKIATHTNEPSTESAAVRASSKVRKKINVSGILFSETKDQVRQHLSQWGDVAHFVIIYNKNGHGRGE